MEAVMVSGMSVSSMVSQENCPPLYRRYCPAPLQRERPPPWYEEAVRPLAREREPAKELEPV